VAETGLFIFSLCAATRLAKPGVENLPLLAQPLVLLRSASELQKQLIESLYEE
jgi:hypothetical protein